jgi:hypothetical protein
VLSRRRRRCFSNVTAVPFWWQEWLTLSDLAQGHAKLSAALKTGVEVFKTEPPPPFDWLIDSLEDAYLRLKFDSLHGFLDRCCDMGEGGLALSMNVRHHGGVTEGLSETLSPGGKYCGDGNPTEPCRGELSTQ